MDMILIISSILIGCILGLVASWLFILKAEAKIEQKIMDEFEAKRKEEQQAKIYQRYEELLTTEIEWHTYRMSTITLFINNVKNKLTAEAPTGQPAVSGDSKLYSKMKALISIYFPHLQNDYNALYEASNCSIYFDFIYGRRTNGAQVIEALTEKAKQFKTLSTEFQNKIRKELDIT